MIKLKLLLIDKPQLKVLMHNEAFDVMKLSRRQGIKSLKKRFLITTLLKAYTSYPD